MAGDEDTPPPSPPSTSADKLIPFSITNKVPVKLSLEKHNYNSWSSFFKIHLGSLGISDGAKKNFVEGRNFFFFVLKNITWEGRDEKN